MLLWDVVHFTLENCVEAVPSTWSKRDKYAWPKDRKLVKKFIESHITPNSNDFVYYPARKLGIKSYGKFLNYVILICYRFLIFS